MFCFLGNWKRKFKVTFDQFALEAIAMSRYRHLKSLLGLEPSQDPSYNRIRSLIATISQSITPLVLPSLNDVFTFHITWRQITFSKVKVNISGKTVSKNTSSTLESIMQLCCLWSTMFTWLVLAAAI